MLENDAVQSAARHYDITVLFRTQVQVTKRLLQQLFYSVILGNVHRRVIIVVWAACICTILQ